MTINIAIKYITNRDGMRFFTQRWLPASPKALIVLIHGLGDHSGRYQHVINHFAHAGYAVAAYDQRGHGLSDGRRGDFDTFGQLVDDLHAFVWETKHETKTGTPVVLIGMNVGGLIAVNYAVSHSHEVDGIVLVSPAIQPAITIPPWKQWIASKLTRITPRLGVNLEFDPSDLSRETQAVDEYRADHRVFHNFTLRAMQNLLEESSMVMPLAFRLRQPLLMLHPTGDKLCSPVASRQFFTQVSHGRKTMIEPEGTYHEPFTDTSRFEAFAKVENWIAENIVQRSVPHHGMAQGGMSR